MSSAVPIPPMPHRIVARGIRALALLALLLAPAACVVIPYTPEASTRHEHAQVPNPERVRLSVGPRNFLDGIAKTVRKKDARLLQIDGQAFIDAASPAQELTLARLLEPATRARIEPLQADYLVLFGEPRDAVLANRGGGVLYLGYYGLQKSRTETRIRAAIIDLRQQRLLEQIHSESTGTNVGLGLFYGVFVVSDTSGSALEGLAGRIVAGIAEARPAGPVRVVFLADEPIPTPAEIAAAERRNRPPPPTRWHVERHPPYSEPGSLAPGLARVVLYRPEDITGMFSPLPLLTGTAPDERAILSLWSGGYFVWDAPPGHASLRVEYSPEATVELDLAPGMTYFVKGWMKMGWKAPKPALAVVGAEEARKKLQRCRRLPAGYDDFEQIRRFAEDGGLEYQLELAALYARGARFVDGRSVPHDDVAAYTWLAIAASTELDPASPWATITTLWRERAVKERAELGARLDAKQLAEGERRAREWLAAH